MESETFGAFLNANLADTCCIYCKELLKYPIRKVENVGNYCSTCFDKSAYIIRRKSTELEYAMLNFLMPCKYSYRGCEEKGTPPVISRHEKVCNYRDKICPLYGLNKCTNPNHLRDLVDHFQKYHSSRVHIGDGQTIELSYEINEGHFEECWLLAFEDDEVLLHAQSMDDRLYYFTYYLGNPEDVRQLVCKIQHRTDEICTNERICKILPENALGNVAKGDGKGVGFDRKTLDKHFGSHLNTTITIERDILNVSSDDILMRLECPVCSNFMRSNIKLCSAGHSVCGECEAKLEECPLCTYPFFGVRNFALESVGDLLKNLVRGEKTECPLRKELQCLWRGTQPDIIEHIKEFHTDRVVINKSVMRVFQYDAEFLEVIYLMSYGQVFKITCKKDKDDSVMIVIIDLIGYDEDVQKYYYNICFNSLYKQSIIWYTKSKILKRRHIEYHVDYVAIGRLICNKQFNISFTISKNTTLIY